MRVKVLKLSNFINCWSVERYSYNLRIVSIYNLDVHNYKIVLHCSTADFIKCLATPATKKKIDKQRLNELDSSTLVDLIKDYMEENQVILGKNSTLGLDLKILRLFKYFLFKLDSMSIKNNFLLFSNNYDVRRK